MSVKRKISEEVLKSFGAMRVTMGFLAECEQHHLQALCKWFYRVGVSRVQISIKVYPKTAYFTWLQGGALALYVIGLLPGETRVTLLAPEADTSATSVDDFEDFTNFMWYSCQVGRHSLF